MSGTLEAPPPPRSPWQRFYGAVHRWRHAHWQRHGRRLAKPVISIGNLHWGGSGKTPLTAAVASHLRDRGLRVTILSRGYGSKGQGVRLVSRGQGPLLDATRGGDEPVLLAQLLPGVSIVVSPDRYLGGTHALEVLDLAPDVFLLDDGFSHLRLARDLDLLAFPASDPFAGGRLFPAGRLREPLASAARADAVLLTGGDAADAGQRLAATLGPHGFAGPGFVSFSRLLPPDQTLQGEPLPAASPVMAMCAIARPEPFVQGVRDGGFAVVEELALPDHHAYDGASLERIRRRFAESAARALIITDKDRVKLEGRLDLPLAVLSLRAEPQAEFFQWLDHRLAAWVSQPRPKTSASSATPRRISSTDREE